MAPGKVFLLLLYTFHVCGVSSVVHNGKTTINETFEQLAGAGGSSSSSSSSGGGLDVHSNPNHHSVATLKQTRWAEAAYGYVHTLNCAEAFITTERECRNLVRLKRSAMNIYLADPTAYGRYGAVLPDGGLSKAGLHDGVLVVDPYPQANFGHIVIVFFLDLGTTRTVCTRDGGSYLGKYSCLFTTIIIIIIIIIIISSSSSSSSIGIIIIISIIIIIVISIISISIKNNNNNNDDDNCSIVLLLFLLLLLVVTPSNWAIGLQEGMVENL